MQVIATGKWSKAEKQWKMVVALRRPGAGSPGPSTKQTNGRNGATERAPKRPRA